MRLTRVPPLVGSQTQWRANFVSAQAQLRRLFEAVHFRTELIGSTAVAGLCAKPVIDMVLGAPSWALIEAQVPALAGIGYTYRPVCEAPLPERRYFVRPAQGAMPRIHLAAVPRRRSHRMREQDTAQPPAPGCGDRKSCQGRGRDHFSHNPDPAR